MYFPNYGLRKTWLDNCLKSPVPYDLFTRTIVNRPKHCFNLNDSTFAIYLLITMNTIESEKDSFNDMENINSLLTH